MAIETTVQSDATKNGWLNYSSAWEATKALAWDSAHDAVNASGGGQGEILVYPGVKQLVSGANYWYSIERAFLYFDTSVISGTVLSADLKLYGWKEHTDEAYVLHVVEGIQHQPIVDADYGAHVNKTTSGGSIASGSITNETWFTIPLNSDGKDWINLNGITKLCLRLDSDKDDNSLSGSIDKRVEFAVYNTKSSAAYKPKLVITYGYVYTNNIGSLVHHYNRNKGLYQLDVTLGGIEPYAY